MKEDFKSCADFDAGDWLKLENDLHQQIRAANLQIMIDEEILKFVEKKLKGFKKDFDKTCPPKSK